MVLYKASFVDTEWKSCVTNQIKTSDDSSVVEYSKLNATF